MALKPRRKLLLGLTLALALAGVAALVERGREAAPGAPNRDLDLVLARLGERLALSRSAAELAELSRSARKLEKLLEDNERDNLGRGLVRFRISTPATVTLAFPEAFVPFWVEERGFQKLTARCRNRDADFALYSRRFAAGVVELGVNWLDPASPAHYAIFVGPEARHQPLPEISWFPGEEHRRIAAVEGASPDAEVDRPFDRLPAELHGCVLVQTRESERRQVYLYEGRPRKTHVPSGSFPDQIVITPLGDRGTSLSWTWRTLPEIRGSMLRLARADRGPPGPGGSWNVAGTSELVRTPRVANDPIVRRHEVRAGDLEPDTAYYYSVGDGGSESWSPWRIVRTGPKPKQDWEFLYLGDAQTGLESWGKLLASAYRRNPGARFAVVTGDLVDRGNDRTNWDHFFLRAQPVFETLPFVPVVGNHEYLDVGPRLFRSFFRPPVNGPAGFDAYLNYGFTYGDTFLAVLDSTAGVTDDLQARRQALWLEETLSRSRARWKIVMFHHPVHASHPHRESPGLAAAWIPVFDRARVDLVLQGHDHAYLRTHPIRSGQANPMTSAGVPNGTIYAVAVSGDKYYNQDPRGLAAVAKTRASTYQVVRFRDQGGELAYTAYLADGTVIDEFAIKKPAAETNHSVAVTSVKP